MWFKDSVHIGRDVASSIGSRRLKGTARHSRRLKIIVTQGHIPQEEDNPHTSMIHTVMLCAVTKDSTDSRKVKSGTNHSEDMENTLKMKIGFNLRTEFNWPILIAEFRSRGTNLD